jgi:hypothetical protein
MRSPHLREPNLENPEPQTAGVRPRNSRRITEQPSPYQPLQTEQPLRGVDLGQRSISAPTRPSVAHTHSQGSRGGRSRNAQPQPARPVDREAWSLRSNDRDDASIAGSEPPPYDSLP